tara:strand:+ start:3024 stop:3833 length:810 start_codon:yes stop_codon:yes gene_type:complete
MKMKLLALIALVFATSIGCSDAVTRDAAILTLNDVQIIEVVRTTGDGWNDLTHRWEADVGAMPVDQPIEIQSSLRIANRQCEVVWGNISSCVPVLVRALAVSVTAGSQTSPEFERGVGLWLVYFVSERSSDNASDLLGVLVNSKGVTGVAKFSDYDDIPLEPIEKWKNVKTLPPRNATGSGFPTLAAVTVLSPANNEYLLYVWLEDNRAKGAMQTGCFTRFGIGGGGLDYEYDDDWMIKTRQLDRPLGGLVDTSFVQVDTRIVGVPPIC